MDDLISRKAAIDAVGNVDCSDGVGISAIACEVVEDIQRAIKDLPSAQPETHDKRTETHACDLISRQWLMECVNEGWIKFDTKKDENRFIHLVRDIAPSAQQDIEEDEDIPMEYFENGGI